MLKLYNTLTRSVEEFKPISSPHVGMYSCGPTVYDYAHIGNFRTYLMSDILVRTLKLNNYQVKWVMNITDVGHLVSDGDTGEDKMEKGSRRTGKTAWEIADFYTQAFLTDWKKLNLLEPDVRPKPTEHIPEQIALVKQLLEKGFAYQIDDGIYFDTSKFPNYGQLARLDLAQLKEGARVEINPQKKNPTDFALWKFSPKNEKRQMEWESPWGVGFPGWHIECSAMSMKYLGEQFDIHTGGTDILPVHHVNEIAQSEAAIGKKPWVKYWVHGQMMMIEGEKMSKSLNNIYRLEQIEEKGFETLALRYLYLQTHYRQEMNFTWESLNAAQIAYRKLLREILNLKSQISNKKQLIGCAEFEEQFHNAVNDDMNMAKALSIVWELMKSDYPASAKMATLEYMDQVLGLDVTKNQEVGSERQEKIPEEVLALVEERDAFRKKKDYKKADDLREKIRALGFDITDTREGTKIVSLKK